MPTLRALSIALVLALGVAGAARAGERQVSFAKGATTALVSGKIVGRDDASYRINAGADQTLRVQLKASNRSCYFNLFAPGAAEAAHIGSTAGDQFSVDRTRPGAYRAQVYLMRNAARRQQSCSFRLTIELTPAMSPGGTGSDRRNCGQGPATPACP